MMPLVCGAVSDTDMAARHRARASSIHIIRVEEVAASKCRRANIVQFHVSRVTFSVTAVLQCSSFMV